VLKKGTAFSRCLINIYYPFCGCSEGAYLLLLRKRHGDGLCDGRVQAAMEPTGWDAAKKKKP
jgi:hypothetical protein